MKKYETEDAERREGSTNYSTDVARFLRRVESRSVFNMAHTRHSNIILLTRKSADRQYYGTEKPGTKRLTISD